MREDGSNGVVVQGLTLHQVKSGCMCHLCIFCDLDSCHHRSQRVVIGLFCLMVCMCMSLYTFFYFVAQICRAHPWSSWLWQQKQDAAPHWHERFVFPLPCRIPGKRLLAILSLFLCKHGDKNIEHKNSYTELDVVLCNCFYAVRPHSACGHPYGPERLYINPLVLILSVSYQFTCVNGQFEFFLFVYFLENLTRQ